MTCLNLLLIIMNLGQGFTYLNEALNPRKTQTSSSTMAPSSNTLDSSSCSQEHRQRIQHSHNLFLVVAETWGGGCGWFCSFIRQKITKSKNPCLALIKPHTLSYTHYFIMLLALYLNSQPMLLCFLFWPATLKRKSQRLQAPLSYA